MPTDQFHSIRRSEEPPAAAVTSFSEKAELRGVVIWLHLIAPLLTDCPHGDGLFCYSSFGIRALNKF
jgi:hypothetical protein